MLATEMKKKGGWGIKKTQRDEATDVKCIGSEIKTGGDLTLESGGDQKSQAAKLDSGGDIAIASGGAVKFEAIKDLRQERHEKSKNSLVWTSSQGKGNTDETLHQTQMIVEGTSAIVRVVRGFNKYEVLEAGEVLLFEGTYWLELKGRVSAAGLFI